MDVRKSLNRAGLAGVMNLVSLGFAKCLTGKVDSLKDLVLKPTQNDIASIFVAPPLGGISAAVAPALDKHIDNRRSRNNGHMDWYGKVLVGNAR